MDIGRKIRKKTLMISFISIKSFDKFLSDHTLHQVLLFRQMYTDTRSTTASISQTSDTIEVVPQAIR